MNSPLQLLAKKLRHTADMLDELSTGWDIFPSHQTEVVAARIRQTLHGKKKGGFRYKKGTHWTQKPENATKLARMVKKNGAKRRQS